MATSLITLNNLIFRCFLWGATRGSAQPEWLIIEDHEPVILTSGAVLTNYLDVCPLESVVYLQPIDINSILYAKVNAHI